MWQLVRLFFWPPLGLQVIDTQTSYTNMYRYIPDFSNLSQNWSCAGKSICSTKYVNFRSILSGSFVYNCVKWTFTLYHLMRTLTAVLICSNLSLIVVWKFLPLWFRDHKLYVYCSDPWFKLSFRRNVLSLIFSLI